MHMKCGQKLEGGGWGWGAVMSIQDAREIVELVGKTHHVHPQTCILILLSLYAHAFCTVCILQLLYQNPQFKLLSFYPCHCSVQSCYRTNGAVTGWGRGTERQWGSWVVGQWGS